MRAQPGVQEDMAQHAGGNGRQPAARAAQLRVLSTLSSEASYVPGSVRSGRGFTELLGSQADRQLALGEGCVADAVPDLSGDQAASPEGDSHDRFVDPAE